MAGIFENGLENSSFCKPFYVHASCLYHFFQPEVWVVIWVIAKEMQHFTINKSEVDLLFVADANTLHFTAANILIY